jgi:N-acetylglucosaminyldiphosphoundecaprenol N-acetyl-beta-D-mannosaminyltransferase
VTILNGTFDALTIGETVDAVFAMIGARTRGWLCTVNVATLMTMRGNAALQAFVDRATWVVADGQPIVWCAPLFGGELPERVTGIDLLDALCRRAAGEGQGVYLLGATAPLVARAMVNLRKRHPGLRVEGADGYFAKEEWRGRAEAIRASDARLLFVGMGTPRQESFIAEEWDELGVNVAIGVGGTFDVIAGARFRAFPWVGRVGLEWVARLIQEPDRLLPRYLVTNAQFCWLIANVMGQRMRQWLVPKG